MRGWVCWGTQAACMVRVCDNKRKDAASRDCSTLCRLVPLSSLRQLGQAALAFALEAYRSEARCVDVAGAYCTVCLQQPLFPALPLFWNTRQRRGTLVFQCAKLVKLQEAMAEPEKDQSWSLFKAMTTTSPYSLPRVLGLASPPAAVEGRTNSEPVAAGRTPSNLRPIKTPHSYPASHPGTTNWSEHTCC